MIGAAQPASLPPAGLPGLDTSWSRLVDVTDTDGASRTFHVLDNWAGRTDEPVGTLLCVHGNPTWSYLWRRLFAVAPTGWRVVAPDHLGMGYSERVEQPRVLVQRVDDLGRLTAALGVTGPVVTVAHDWGGIISLGWAVRHREQLRGIVLFNTAVHQPSSSGPLLIRLAHVPLINRLACRLTPLFVRTTTSLTWPRLPRDVREAFAAPYDSIAQRRGVGEFVADIPFATGHPSRAAVDEIAGAIPTLDVPALLLWGPRDPVFLEEHLRDLRERLPQAAVHRYENASHLTPEDAPDYPAAIGSWLRGLSTEPTPVTASGAAADLPSVLDELTARAENASPAVVEVGGRSISWSDLHTRVRDTAAGMAAAGVRPGDRVALLVPPSIELTVALYSVWRAGGVIVVVDRGLGLRGMGRALRGSSIDHVIAGTAGLLASRPMRVPGTRIATREVSTVLRTAGRVAHTMPGLADAGRDLPTPPAAALTDEAAVVFTSGATGPAKGVLYRHRQLRAQLALIRSSYGITGGDRIVAAFAPFALYGPALGVPSAVPSTDVTKPAALTAAALADAAVAVEATVVFASPAALANVLATAADLTAAQRAALHRVRLLMSAGAPVPAAMLRRLSRILPNAELHTPYGMTEGLPLTDISLPEIEAAGEGDGVCVGRPLPGVQVLIAALDPLGTPADELTDGPGVSGEIWVRAGHLRDRYDTLWLTNQASTAHPGWHRTGDVGALDAAGRLWVQGRLVHVISTPAGPVTPVGVEQRVQSALAEQAPAVDAAAAGRPTAAVVGVGPAGTQQVVVVLTGRGGPLASSSVAAVTRAAAGVDVAAVLLTKALPVDIRHNSKIDRIAVGRWAADLLSGSQTPTVGPAAR